MSIDSILRMLNRPDTPAERHASRIAADLLTHQQLYGRPAPVGSVWHAGFTPGGDLCYARRTSAAWLVEVRYAGGGMWVFGIFPPDETGERRAKAFAAWTALCERVGQIAKGQLQ